MQGPVICLIAAVARHGAIGRDNRLLMHLPGDLPRFKQLTAGCPLIMGRKTWDSIGRPLPGRRSIVLSRDPGWHATGAERVASLGEALRLAAPAPRVFVIGGGQIYAQALPLAHELHLTELDAELPADTWFPPWNRDDFDCSASEPLHTADGHAYRYTTCVRRPTTKET